MPSGVSGMMTLMRKRRPDLSAFLTPNNDAASSFDMESYRFLFIVTYGRSGSTLLQKIIGSNGGYHIVGENNNVLHALLCAYERASEAKRTEGNEPRDRLGDPWYGIHLTDPERFGRDLARLFVQEFIRPPRGACTIGFKEIRYIDYPEVLERHLDYMRALFQPALFVFNRRNSGATANSLAAWWKDLTVAQIVSELEAFDRRMEAYAAAHPNDTILVDYDAYTRDPDQLKPLFARLGETFDRKKIEQIMSVRLTH
jgi:hypothetical protein